MLLKPLVYEPAKHIYRLLTEPDYLNWCIQDAKLSGKNRFTHCHTRIHGNEIFMPDAASFLSAYHEIFVNKIYQFDFSSATPRILDLGANIGLSVLFFKRQYPDSQITAFEADPVIFDYLKKNLSGNGIADVELINKAIWHENTVLNFHAEGADGGHITKADSNSTISIDAVDINEFLQVRKYDFIKMDIEGAEDTVFPACKGHLLNVKYVFVEYHSRIGQPQKLANIIGLMSEAGFRVDIHSINNSRLPYIRKTRNSDLEFDLQLNIFAWKD